MAARCQASHSPPRLPRSGRGGATSRNGGGSLPSTGRGAWAVTNAGQHGCRQISLLVRSVADRFLELRRSFRFKRSQTKLAAKPRQFLHGRAAHADKNGSRYETADGAATWFGTRAAKECWHSVHHGEGLMRVPTETRRLVRPQPECFTGANQRHRSSKELARMPLLSSHRLTWNRHSRSASRALCTRCSAAL